MQLDFTCRQNANAPYINGAVFRLTDGRIIRIDRDRTGFSWNAKNKILGMTWYNPYIWDGDNANYNIPEEITKSTFVAFDIEEDAPQGYFCECIECYVNEHKIHFEKPELVGFLFRHGCDDLEFWQHDLPKEVVQKIEEVISKYDTTGCSVRGNASSIAKEIEQI